MRLSCRQVAASCCRWHSSSPEAVTSGVPQRHGPRIFTFYLQSVVSSHVRPFADGCLKSRSVSSAEDQVAIWARDGAMRRVRLNAKKCHIMTLDRGSPSSSNIYSLRGDFQTSTTTTTTTTTTATINNKNNNNNTPPATYACIKKQGPLYTHFSLQTFPCYVLRAISYCSC